MKITKIRIKRRSISISYQNDGNDFSLTSTDRPRPEMYQALNDLQPIMLEILHLPEDYSEGLKPTGLTLVDKQEVQLVTLVGQKSLPECHSPLNLATPLRFLEHPKEEGSYSPALDQDAIERISALVEEAKAYVKGDRAQGQLPLDEEKVEEEADEKPSEEEAIELER